MEVRKQNAMMEHVPFLDKAFLVFMASTAFNNWFYAAYSITVLEDTT